MGFFGQISINSLNALDLQVQLFGYVAANFIKMDLVAI